MEYAKDIIINLKEGHAGKSKKRERLNKKQNQDKKAVVTEATKCKSLQTNWLVSGSTGKRSTVCKENI